MSNTSVAYDKMLKSPEKFRQDYQQLLSFTKELNEKLHIHKILGSQRILLISCVLIALEDEAFRVSYDKKNSPQSLAEFLTKTVSEKLKEANILGETLNNLETQFSFINTDASLSKNEGVLKGIIGEIDKNINSFVKTHEYFDVLGQLYIEFLRYANSDKGLGIVLTPPHITDFFAKLAHVNKHSVVYDNCTGTAGFLIAAMGEMIKDAKGDDSLVASIKSKQLIGTEYQSHIYALAVSNMYIHQDGKTNIIHGSCFDSKTVALVKEQKPTVGLLNPPYKANKKKDIEELEFVLNNLECLTDGGTCIAIVPMQCALAKKGKVLELKKKLLENHTLEAVLSMPDELFFNSKVGVVSCIMIFTAHRKHPSTKKTYLGYYKKDGFVKRKIHGRVDANGSWDSIKEQWLTSFVNRTDIDGFSITVPLKHNDEWCAEAYMQTNYKSLTNAHFESTLLNYSTYLFANKITNTASDNPKIEAEAVLNVDEWKFFDFSEIFNIKGSKTTPLLELEEYGSGCFPYVTTQATNNGVGGFFDYYTEKGNVLTVDSAVLGYCSYQAFNFSASDHVEILSPKKFRLNKYIALFLVSIINRETYRYNYGRKCSQDRMKQTQIKLPAKGNEVDTDFMERFIKSLPYSDSI